jgi:hypothetical protein
MSKTVVSPNPPVATPAAGGTSATVHRVKATREGLIGGCTACGWVIDVYRPFVALPSKLALNRVVRVRNPVNGKQCVAEVLDVGPWNTDDHSYVFGTARPLAEQGISISGKGTNSAGIDLGEAVWRALGMTDNSEVEWQFV